MRGFHPCIAWRREARTVKSVRSCSTFENENSLDCCWTVAGTSALISPRARASRIGALRVDPRDDQSDRTRGPSGPACIARSFLIAQRNLSQTATRLY